MVLMERGTFESPIPKTDSHKRTDGIGIGNVKGQVPIGVANHLLYQCRSKNLLGRYPSGAAFDSHLAFGKILVNQIKYGIILVQNEADSFQLFRFGMIDVGGRQRHLFFGLFAHFVSGPFHLLLVVLVCCSSIHTTGRSKCPAQNALFLFKPHSYYSGQTLD